jgi:hypothetical protein
MATDNAQYRKLSVYDFIGEHVDFAEPEVVANDLRDRLQRSIGGPGASECIVQFATFALREGHVVPEFWHITNIPGVTETGYQTPSETFVASERLLGVHLKDESITPGNIRDYLGHRALQFAPFWFHQGIDLIVFNTLSEAARQAFADLQRGGSLQRPSNLIEWERYARMWVLIYGAYFEAFARTRRKVCGRERGRSLNPLARGHSLE